ncbi:MAG: S41 family peptidase [Candidatus Scatovivens sp.]
MEDEENKKWKRSYIINTILICCVVAFLSSCITYDVYSRKENENFSNSSSTEEGEIVSSEDSNKKISEAIKSFRKQIDKYYIGDIDEQKLLDCTLKGYIEGLDDEYSEYMTSTEWEDYQADALGNYVGIGIYMSMDVNNNVVVVSPIKGTPAEEAGLQSGDIIVGVDDESVVGKNSSDVSNLVKGEEGTKVKITILRKEQYLEFEIERKAIKVYHVEKEMLENNIGYIKLITFDEGCAEELKASYEELKNSGAKKIILDLRDNTGGLVDEALKIADYVVEKGNKLLITVDSKENKEYDYAKEEPIINENMVILVNEYSASASEILVGALKDNEKAKTVGTKTYGKGVIQSVFFLKDNSALKLTVQEYYTPNETKINKVGIEPDYVIENDKNTEIDEQLQKAIEILK